jgi:Bacterial membrane protein YfhO
MSKKKVKNKKAGLEKVSFLDNIPSKYRNIIAAIIIALPLLYYFIPYAVNNVTPTGSDFIANVGQTHRWVEWSDKTGETVLWNPSIFGGEPIYPRLTPKLIHIDTLITYFSKILSWFFWYLFLGGMGIYFLLRYKDIPWYIAIIVGVVFVLLPDWQAQIGEGHNSKLRALMTLPWFILSFSYFFDKKTWISTGLFALSFSWLVRTHHFQIIFYGILILFFLYIYPTIKLFFKKEFKSAGNLILKFGVALFLTFMTAAQPLFTTNEYAKYSIRGGNPVQIGKDAQSAKKASGVDFNYATQWSFSPNELLDFFIPHFSGGISTEIYNGDKYPQLKGRQLPGYWGEKPFSGNYANIGMILFLFAMIGIIYYRKDKFVIALAVFTVFSIFLSFGRHFPELYKLFFYYVPYFSKFRAPAMTLNATFIIILILSGFGLKAFINASRNKDIKIIASVFGAGLAILALVFITYDSFAYSTAREATQYDNNTLSLLKEVRKEFLFSDLKRLLIIMIITSGFVAAYLYKKIGKELIIAAILLLSVIEIFYVSNRANSIIQLNNAEQLEKSIYKETTITKILNNDKDNMRGIALAGEFTSNHYAYFYPLISGYSAIKLQIVQDVIEHNLFSAKTNDRINWNIINMLNGKYVISPGQLNSPFLRFITQDSEKKQILYENKNALPKAWFVTNVNKMKSPEDVVLFMNTSQFKPDSVALIVNDERNLADTYSGLGNIILVEHNPNFLEFDVQTDSEQFLIISEIYYPEGWIAKLDNEEIDIHQVNHLLRGVNIKAGNHNLTFEFKPATYYASLTYLWIGNIAILFLIIVPMFFNMFKKKRAQL